MGGKGSGGRRKNSDELHKSSPAYQSRTPDPDVNHRMIEMGKRMLRWPIFTDYDDPQKVNDRFEDYVNLCDEYGFRPLVEGTAMALSMDRTCLSDIGLGRMKKYKNATPETIILLQNIYRFLSASVENNLSEERGNPVKWIFLMKNHFKYQDQSERIVRTIDESAQLPSAEELSKKYAAMAGKEQKQLEEAQIIDVKPIDED